MSQKVSETEILLNDAAEKLKEGTVTLYSQISRCSLDSRDSGLGSKDLSRNLSVASLDISGSTHDNFDPLQSINEDQDLDHPSLTRQRGTVDILEHSGSTEAEEVDCPVKITVQEDPASDFKDLKPVLRDLDSNNYLIPPRKHSAASSIASDEYVTPPTSPVTPVSISRSVSVESSSSCGSQEMRFQMELHTPSTNEKLTIKTKTKLPKKSRDVHVVICLCSRSDRIRRRSKSSPVSSTPNSPSSPGKKLSLTIHQGIPFPLLKVGSADAVSPLMSSPKEFPKATPTDPYSPPQHHREEIYHSEHNLIADIIRRNMLKFIESTDLDSLYPCLFQAGLISKKDWEELQSFTTTRKKMNFFYIFLLESKGVSAYEKLYDCLKEEKEHLGHQDLVRIIEREIDLPG